MVFKDREDAGTRLAKRLGAYVRRDDVVVLGLPRGGVPVAFEVALALDAPLDVFLSQKLGVPGREELAFGALAQGGIRYLNETLMGTAGVSAEDVARATAAAEVRLAQRAELFRRNKPPLAVAGKIVILVDDGIATGASMYAAIMALRQMRPARVVVVTPVAPGGTCKWLEQCVDEVVCLSNPSDFYAVGEFYLDFPQLRDDEVRGWLERADKLEQAKLNMPRRQSSEAASGQSPGAADIQRVTSRDVMILVDEVRLAGILAIPAQARGLVVFAHGSGSSRLSARNQRVAEVLQAHGLATLLFDLLTATEERQDERTGRLRFDIGLLAARLVQVTRWVAEREETAGLPIGYFGASTGAAAALMAAAELVNLVRAVVSRGGRPDLAMRMLGQVKAPTLLLVGSRDEPVVEMNRQAYEKLASGIKELRIVEGATHLFEEPGKMDDVAQAAAEWFQRSLANLPRR